MLFVGPSVLPSALLLSASAVALIASAVVLFASAAVLSASAVGLSALADVEATSLEASAVAEAELLPTFLKSEHSLSGCVRHE